ncbi:MAG: Asp-tRNA(Asn)/Glu-tRNA(Gln) amidotransferase subunit GatC [Paracoccaceae bacterium]|nr:Asp-tRNA(Asn)/Glu-tRNA(Gln) amidotransferase subunit GatC [Paracoccaceae bacterium]
MSIDNDRVKKIAHLARIELSADDIKMFSKQIGEIIGLMNQLNEVDISDILSFDADSSKGHRNRTEDIVKDGNYIELILQNAPEPKEGFFTVKKVIE